MRKYINILLLLVISMMFLACEKKVQTDLSTVHWDRDMCSRCVMVVSDRKHAVQVKDPQTGKSYMFDDIGCVALWFKEEQISWKDKAVIWITDASTQKFIDARSAFYDTDNITPMSFGFWAHKTKDTIPDEKDILSYDEVISKILSE
ncbi:hypothetical protein [Sulfurimonas sp.]|uniref:hypothetical protein n=1 Tax=Sulfurimonas sp. TaxID=2022749 RepID=UPI002AB062BC|nr:hypothetical protein [Sulfurimonas sp.]